MMKFPWVGVVKLMQGKLSITIRDRDEFDTFVERNFREGDKVWLRIELPAKDWTHEQFKYLYSCVYPFIAEEWGCDVEEVDRQLKERHGIKSKSKLTREELSEYIDACRRDAALLGIETMDPAVEETR